MNCKNPECNKELNGATYLFWGKQKTKEYCDKTCRVRHHAILYPWYEAKYVKKEEIRRRENMRDSGLHLKTILDCGGYGDSDASKLELESWSQGDIL